MRLAIAAAMAVCLGFGGSAAAKTLPWGGDASGNSDGSIPAWTGPKGLKTIQGERLRDPFPGDKPLFVIDRSNYKKHAKNLSEGQIAMMKRYPTYKIPVYKTRRIFDLPDWNKTAIAKESPRISLLKDQGLKGLNLSTVPFPKPKNGLEAIWNHIVRFRGATVERGSYTIPVQQNGARTVSFTEEKIAFRKGLKGSDNSNVLIKYLNIAKSPARFKGRIVLVHEFIDQIKEPRAAWLYNTASRRVRRAPNLAYDAPLEFSDAGATTDDFDMYNGAPDRYTWKLLGKKEMFVPANGFRLATSGSVDPIIKKGHLNSSFTRFEKRRVWVVEATLKKGKRHLYGRRVFYLDEDGWAIVLSDQYDTRGDLWRSKELHTVFISSNKANFNAAQTVYDLKSGGYLAVSLLTGNKAYLRFDKPIKDKEFTPAALRRQGR